jgi:hypothetical protein
MNCALEQCLADAGCGNGHPDDGADRRRETEEGELQPEVAPRCNRATNGASGGDHADHDPKCHAQRDRYGVRTLVSNGCTDNEQSGRSDHTGEESEHGTHAPRTESQGHQRHESQGEWRAQSNQWAAEEYAGAVPARSTDYRGRR